MAIEVPDVISSRCPPERVYPVEEAQVIENRLIQQTIARILITPVVMGFWEFSELEQRRVGAHVADIILRKKWGYANEHELSLEDVIFIAVAVEKRKKELWAKERSNSNRHPLFHYMPACVSARKNELIDRACSYFVPLFEKSRDFAGEDTDFLSFCVACEFDNKVDKAAMAQRLGVTVSTVNEYLKDRLGWLKEEADVSSLGLLSINMSPSHTLTTGRTYIQLGNAHSVWDSRSK